MQTRTFAETKRFVLSCFRACAPGSRVVPCLIGVPGVGKSALAAVIAAELARLLVTLIGSNCDATDIAGSPWISEGQFLRALIPEIDRACKEGVILFIDEFTTVPPSVRAPLMRLILEGKVQGAELHPDTRLMVAMNDPEHCPGGIELDVATGNRLVRVGYCPSLDEVRGYFDTLGDEGSALREEGIDFAATCSVAPDLVSFEPPRASVETGAPYASPRAWELALRAFVADGSSEDDVGFSLLAGAVGEESAVAYLGIKKMRKDLPSIEQILADPIHAVVPNEASKQVAAIGLLSRISVKDAWAAWAYAERLKPEISVACASLLAKRPATKLDTHEKAGKQARVKLLAKIQTTVLS